MDVDLAETFDVFLSESQECLDSMESALLDLESRPESRDPIDDVFRAAHTIKGNSRSLGFAELGSFAHEVENLLERVRAREVHVDSGLITLLLQAADVIRRWLPRLHVDEESRPDAAALAVQGRIAAHGRSEPEASRPTGETGVRVSAAAAELHSMRVQTARMDGLLNLAAEATVAVERVRRRIDVLPGSHRDGPADAVADLERVIGELHSTVTRCRMVPIGPTFRRHRRTVRDLAAALGKRVHLELSGEDVELDVTAVEALADPLVHMIRNAIDHGFEQPEARVAAGKPAAGTLTLSAAHERGSIVIQVADDGRGISRARLRERATAMGWDVASLEDDAVIGLLFRPGVSTADQVSEASGRGVGMDVVRRNIERVRGRIGVESTEGLGTTFTLRLPLTLAAIPGFIVSAGGEYFVIPMSEIDECLPRRPEGPGERSSSGVMNVRGEGVPYLCLRDHFGFGGQPSGPEVVVVVNRGDSRAGLVVDDVVGESHVIVKPLASLLRGLPGLSGAAVVASGSVAMVIDAPGLFGEVERAHADAGGGAPRMREGAE